MLEDGAVKTKEDATKARDYQIQLSRQLLKELMAERGIPYDEKEAKLTVSYIHVMESMRFLWFALYQNYVTL